MKRIFALLLCAIFLAACGSGSGDSTKKAEPDPRKGYLSQATTADINELLLAYNVAYSNSDATSADYIACVKLKGAALNPCIAKLRQAMADTTEALSEQAKGMAEDASYNDSCKEAITVYAAYTSGLSAAWAESAEAWSSAKVDYDVTDRLDGVAFTTTEKFREARKALTEACWTEADQKAAEEKVMKDREGYLSAESRDSLNAKLALVDAAVAKTVDGKSLEACGKFSTQAQVSACILKVVRPISQATRGLDEVVPSLRAAGNYNGKCSAALAAFGDYTQAYANTWSADVAIWQKPAPTAAESEDASRAAYAMDAKLKSEVKKLSDACLSKSDTIPHL